MTALETSSSQPGPELGGLVAHLFRHHAGMITATLTRIFGPEHLDLIEDVVQDALLRALERWPYTGVPEQPSAWLVQTAKHRALDALRRRTLGDRVAARLGDEWGWVAAEADPLRMSREIADDVLGLLLLCCHPKIAESARGPLALRTVAGFSVAEIAAAFLAKPAAIAQRIVRGKRQIRAEGLAFEVPAGDELSRRLDAVLSILYLWFNEGYLAHAGADLVRWDVAQEAIRLGAVVAGHPQTGLPKSHALLALMLFQAARFPARADDRGELLPLAEQDRSRWDHELIDRAFHHLAQSATGDELTAYHLEAGIAACHARAASVEETDFAEIVALYDSLYRLSPSPLVAFHRAAARTRLVHPSTAIEEIEALSENAVLREYYLVPAVLGDLYERLGQWALARRSYELALSRPCSEPERRFLERRLGLLADKFR